MRLLVAASLSLCLVTSVPALAEPVGDLVERGHAAMQAEQWEQALAAFDEAVSRAPSKAPAPTLSFHRGRCLEALGRLVEAREAYGAASAPLPEGAPAAFHDAAARAVEASAALDGRLPVVAIELGPELRGRAAVTLDGAAVAPATTRLAVDPGPHVVTAVADGQTVRRQVNAREGQTHRLRLDGSDETRRVLYGGRLFWGATLGVASLGLTAAFVYSTVRLDGIRTDPGYETFRASALSGDDACALAREGTPGVDYLAAPGAHSRGEMIAACNDADTLQALQIVSVPTAIVTGALAGYLLAHVVEDAPPRLGVVPVIGPSHGGLTLRAAF